MTFKYGYISHVFPQLKSNLKKFQESFSGENENFFLSYSQKIHACQISPDTLTIYTNEDTLYKPVIDAFGKRLVKFGVDSFGKIFLVINLLA
jgi:uncharacterized protein YdhG (YjbR/CyaY superfamily)